MVAEDPDANNSVFDRWVWRSLWLFIDAFRRDEGLSVIFWVFFIRNRYWVLTNGFSASVETVFFFFFFHSLICESPWLISECEVSWCIVLLIEERLWAYFLILGCLYLVWHPRSSGPTGQVKCFFLLCLRGRVLWNLCYLFLKWLTKFIRNAMQTWNFLCGKVRIQLLSQTNGCLGYPFLHDGVCADTCCSPRLLTAPASSCSW